MKINGKFTVSVKTQTDMDEWLRLMRTFLKEFSESPITDSVNIEYTDKNYD